MHVAVSVLEQGLGVSLVGAAGAHAGVRQAAVGVVHHVVVILHLIESVVGGGRGHLLLLPHTQLAKIFIQVAHSLVVPRKRTALPHRLAELLTILHRYPSRVDLIILSCVKFLRLLVVLLAAEVVVLAHHAGVRAAAGGVLILVGIRIAGASQVVVAGLQVGATAHGLDLRLPFWPAVLGVIDAAGLKSAMDVDALI